MNYIQVTLVFAAASIDSFLLLMRKGATSRKLNFVKRIMYPLICAAASLIAIGAGYLIALLISSYPIIGQLNIFITGNILLGLGIFFIWKGRRGKTVPERVDDTFTLKRCFQLALITSIDTLFVGICMGILRIPVANVLLIGGLINLVSSVIALEIGYWQGFYGKWMPIMGGFFMIGIGIYFGFSFVL